MKFKNFLANSQSKPVALPHTKQLKLLKSWSISSSLMPVPDSIQFNSLLYYLAPRLRRICENPAYVHVAITLARAQGHGRH
jgi:hypothetical protein